MKIRNKVVFVYDLEVFPNLLTCTCYNSESKKIGTWEISDRKNDLPEISKGFLNKRIMWCGYNNIHYDDPIINYILLNYKDLIRSPIWKITQTLKDFSDLIINSSTDFTSWSKYKYAHLFKSFDLLTMMFSQKLRCGLKELQITMQYSTVQEYDGDFNSFVPTSEIDNVIKYNINDVLSTTKLLELKKQDIELRLSVEDEYNINALSKDGVNLGMEILKVRYLKETYKTWDEIKDLKSPCDLIKLNEIILPYVRFETPVLKDLLSYLQTIEVSPGRKGLEKEFVIGGVRHLFSVGGLHSISTPAIYIPTKDQILVDQDVESLYPSLLIENNFYPPHLGPEFVQVFKNIKDERIEAKHSGQTLKNQTLKLAINGLTGNLQSEYSWVYSPKTVLQIRINGQLLLLMFIEKLVALGCQILNTNTDGVFYIANKSSLSEIQKVVDWWEGITRLKLEADYFEAMYQFAINDYIAVKQGYSETKNPKLLKKKGLFIDEVTLGRGMAPIVIPKALCNYFVNGISPEETLKNNTDIRDYCTYQKVNKKFKVEYGGKPVTHINRFYMSTNGKSLIKYEIKDGIKIRPTLICASSPVTIINNFEDLTTTDKHVNYNYYKQEIYKIINQMNVKQLSLF